MCIHALYHFLYSQVSSLEGMTGVVKTVGLSCAGLAVAKSIISLASRCILHHESDQQNYSRPFSFYRLERRYDLIDRVRPSQLDTILHKTSVRAVVEAVAEIDEYPERTGKPLQSMKKERLIEIVSILENSLLGISLPCEDFNGLKIPQNSISELFSADLLGYLAHCIETDVHIPLPDNLQAKNLPNLFLYLNEGNHYLKLCEALPQGLYFEISSLSRMQDILERGLKTLEFLEWLKNTKTTLSRALDRTHTSSEKNLLEHVCEKPYLSLSFLVSRMLMFHKTHQKPLLPIDEIKNEENQHKLSSMKIQLAYQKEKYDTLKMLLLHKGSITNPI